MKTLTTAQVCFLMGAIVACVGDEPIANGGGEDGGASSSSGGTSSSGATSSSGGGTSSSGGSSGEVDSGVDSSLTPDAAPPAGCPLGCLPPPPGGWTGPSAVWDDESAKKPAGCPATYTLEEVESHRDMTAAPAVCACAPGTNSGAKCSANARVYTVSGTSCTTKAGFNTLTVDSNGCSTAVGTADNVIVLTPTFAQGTCSYKAPNVTKPAPVYGKETISCGLPQTAATCENRADCVATPIPEAPFTRLCIHKDGDELCPSADYANRFVTYKKIDDQRACNADCAGTPTGGVCGTKWGFTASGKLPGDCLAASVDPPPSDYTAGSSCAPAPPSTSVINGRGLVPTGMACSLTKEATPIGAVTSLDAVTFCCNK